MNMQTTLPGLLAAAILCAVPSAQAATLGYADVVLDFYDSGTGPMPGPYGGTWPPDNFPIPVDLDVVLGDDAGPMEDFLSLPIGSYVTVGFTDETMIDGPGDDLFIYEVIGTASELADIYVSADYLTFVYLGQADTDEAFDLADIGFTAPVIAVKVVGLDLVGGSPGFDLGHVQILAESIGPPIPEPGTLVMLALAGAGLALRKRLLG